VKTSSFHSTRRSFLSVGGGAAALAALGGTKTAAAAEASEVEKANVELVRKICEDIATLDVDKLSEYLADEFQFQLIEGQPIIDGKEKFLAFIKGFAGPFERAEFELHRVHCLGNLVITDRTDRFFAKEGGQDQTFKVTGFHWVKDGKFYEWKDYSLPAE
jgi:limonene-1,2-epoxide hydrolase